MNTDIKIDNENTFGYKKFLSSNGKILLLSKHRSTIDTVNDILKENNIKMKVFGDVDGTFEELQPFNNAAIILDMTLENQHTLEQYYRKIKKENENTAVIFLAGDKLYPPLCYLSYIQFKSTWIVKKPINKEDLAIKVKTAIEFSLNNKGRESVTLSSVPKQKNFVNHEDMVLSELSAIFDNSGKMMDNTNDNADTNDFPKKEKSVNSQSKLVGTFYKQYLRLREIISLVIDKNKFENMDTYTPTGFLLYGHQYIDKRDIIKSISLELHAKFFYIDGAELLTQKRYGEPEEMVRKAFSEAKINAPTVIYLDRLDQLSDNSDYDNYHISRTIFQIHTLLDNIVSHDRIMVIGSANSGDLIHPSFRENGRFDFEFVFELPDRNERLDLLFQFTRKMSLAKDVDLSNIADRTMGYSGSELQKLIRIASTHAMEKSLNNINKNDLIHYPVNHYFENPRNQNTSSAIMITMSDFMFSIEKSRNNVKHKIDRPSSNYKWEEIGGLKETIKELVQDIEWPLKYPKFYKDVGIRPPRGILLYGPPGTGKTSIARAIASTCQANFINIKGPELISKWIGDSEKGIRDTFKKARENAPCIIFFDEIDAIATTRDSDIDNSGVTHRMISQLLTEMDGLEFLEGVTVIGATNRIDVIDKALLRPGRFDKVFNISPPNEDSRVDILKILTKNIKLAKDIDLKSIAKTTDKFTGAELFGLITEAKKISLKEYLANYVNKKNEDILNEIVLHKHHIITAKEKIPLQHKATDSANFVIYR